MKKYLYLAIVALVSAAVVSCGKDKNEPEEDQNATLKIEVSEVGVTTATVGVTASDENAYFYYSVAAVEDLEGYADADLADELISTIDYYVDLYNQYGYDVTFLDFLSQGSAENDFTGLTAETDFKAFAFVIDPEAKALVGNVAYKEFTTEPVPASSNVITITVDPATYVATVTTTNSDPYFFYCESTAEYAQYQSSYDDASIAAEIGDWVYTYEYYGYTLEDLEGYYYFSGNQQIDLTNFMVEYDDNDNATPSYGEYICFAAGYNGGVNTACAYQIYTYAEPTATVAPFKAPAKKFAVKARAEKNPFQFKAPKF